MKHFFVFYSEQSELLLDGSLGNSSLRHLLDEKKTVETTLQNTYIEMIGNVPWAFGYFCSCILGLKDQSIRHLGAILVLFGPRF